MSDMMAAIDADIKEYVNNCERANEKVRYTRTAYGSSLPDCYGEHAKKLRKKQERPHY